MKTRRPSPAPAKRKESARQSGETVAKKGRPGPEQAVKAAKTGQSGQARPARKFGQAGAFGAALAGQKAPAQAGCAQEEACRAIIQRDPAILPPEILAPAGDMASACAAFAAGADAVYLGLKHFSARMQAENFSLSDLARLRTIAAEEKRKVYIAFNTFLKPDEMDPAFRMIKRLALEAAPDALIVQDLGMFALARAAGYAGELHASTLANISHMAALKAVHAAGACRTLIPRELSLDEIRLMDAARPAGLDLEVFIHGALCYCVSGRCWWSSYMGGKSGLRGRCVQPCRRVYRQKGKEGRFFSCMDLSLDMAARTLLALPGIRSWKIEGRKKSPHYVYHATRAYKLLRDAEGSQDVRQEVENLLDMALGRASTKARFWPTQTEEPNSLRKGKNSSTGSGLLLGRIKRNPDGGLAISPATPVLHKDLLRVGHEDEPWHTTIVMQSALPEGRELRLPLPRSGRTSPKEGTPVYLIDRKSPEVQQATAQWEKRCKAVILPAKTSENAVSELQSPVFACKKEKARKLSILVRSSLPHGREGKAGIKPGTVQGLWLTPRAAREVSQTLYGRISWWLPPVIWPDEDALWQRLVGQTIRKGARHFVCNAPWQAGLFPPDADLALTAGPFCNITNAAAIATLARMGFSQAIVSPELGSEGFVSLPGQSPLPLGIVTGGWWPMGLSRHGSGPLKAQETFQSPKGEEFWFRKYGQNIWLYPAWPLDLQARQPALERAGYTTFITLEDFPPQQMDIKRTSEFNWDVDVL